MQHNSRCKLGGLRSKPSGQNRRISSISVRCTMQTAIAFHISRCKYHDIFDISTILHLYNFKCNFNQVYRANSVFIDYYQLFVSFRPITLQK